MTKDLFKTNKNHKKRKKKKQMVVERKSIVVRWNLQVVNNVNKRYYSIVSKLLKPMD